MAAPSDDSAPSANPEAEERIQFMLRLRARGIRDLRLLRALERAPRSLFMPQRYADVAARDIALPIGGGQTSPPPSMVAAMIEALDPPPRGRVLEVGAGSGYATALLAQLSGEVVSLERRRTLALEAAARLSAFGRRQRAGRMGRRARLRPRRSPLRRDPRPRRGRVAADAAAGAARRGRRAGGGRRRRARRPISALSAGSAGRAATPSRRASAGRFAPSDPSRRGSRAAIEPLGVRHASDADATASAPKYSS